MRPFAIYTIVLVAAVAGALIAWRVYLTITTAPPDASWYAAVARLDPIFAVDGTDPQALQTSIQSFLAQRDAIAAGYSASQASEIKKSLYPEEFLLLLPNLQAAREKLLANPTDANAAAYHALLIQTISAYESDAKNLAAALRGPAAFTPPSGPASSTPLLAFMGGFTSPEYIATAMDAVAGGAEMQKQKEQARYACAEHYVAASCEPLQAFSAARTTKVSADANAAPLPAPDAGTKAADALIQSIENQYVPDFSPLLALITPCFPYPVTYMRSWQYTAPDGRQAEKSYVANDAYFWDEVRSASSSDILSKKEVAMGSVFEYQDIANYYMCPDPGQYSFDVERIMSARELAQTATTSEAEHFVALPVVSKSDAAQFVLSNGSEEAFEQYIEGSAHFDETIEELTEANTFVLLEKSVGGTIKFSYLYTTRNYASILFLLDNSTFAPYAPSLFSQIGGTPPDPELRSWRNDLSKIMSVSDIVADAKKSQQVENALSNQ